MVFLMRRRLFFIFESALSPTFTQPAPAERYCKHQFTFAFPNPFVVKSDRPPNFFAVRESGAGPSRRLHNSARVRCWSKRTLPSGLISRE
jgi:hypothetical protein